MLLISPLRCLGTSRLPGFRRKRRLLSTQRILRNKRGLGLVVPGLPGADYMRHRRLTLALPFNARRGEKSLAAGLRSWDLHRLGLRLLGLALQVAAADALRHERLDYATLRALPLRHLGHRIAPCNIHRAGVVYECGQILRRYLAVVDLPLHRFKVQLPAFVLLQAHRAGGDAAVHFVGYLAAQLLRFGSYQAARVLHFVQLQAGFAVRHGKRAVFLSVLPVAHEVPSAALAPREPAAAFDERVYLKVDHRFQTAWHVHPHRRMLHR